MPCLEVRGRARLEVLSTLVEAYERVHHPIEAPDPIAAIRFRLEQRGLTRKALEGVIGSRARVSEVLNRKRPLTLQMIRRLKQKFDIPADLLIAHATRFGSAAEERTTSRGSVLGCSRRRFPSATRIA